VHNHDPPIVHGDLKGANILVSQTGDALLCDFGLASVMDASYFAHNSPSKGTWRWMAPELFATDDARHTTYSDIWALGCVALEILSGCIPFHTITTEQRVILAIDRHQLPSLSRPPRVPESLWNVMLECWTFEPTGRPCVTPLLRRV
ncbi:kinase-like protein, partial [Exidia glandulosa HHB12029]